MPKLKEYLKELGSAEQSERSVLDRSVTRLVQLGFDLEEQPTRNGKAFVPRIPMEGISTLSNEEIRDLHGQFIEVKAYAEEQATIQKIMADEYENEANHVQIKVKLALEGPVNVREDKAKVHKKVLKLRDAGWVCLSTYRLLLPKIEKFSLGQKACSRDVEFRTRELDDRKRESAISSLKKARLREDRRREEELGDL